MYRRLLPAFDSKNRRRVNLSDSIKEDLLPTGIDKEIHKINFDESIVNIEFYQQN